MYERFPENLIVDGTGEALISAEPEACPEQEVRTAKLKMRKEITKIRARFTGQS